MKHKLTRLTSLVLAFIMTFSMLLVPVEATGFTDVPNGSWYQGAVDYVYEKGWMVGVNESTFAPDMEVTRGMFVTVLAKFAEADMGAVTPAFTDTPAGAWYTAACAWAAEKGIVAGAGNGRFLPNRSITRQDLAAILYRFIEKQGYDITAGQPVSFNDAASISAYAVNAVNFVSSVGLMTGADGGKFLPKETATRSQLAQILMKLDGLVNGTTLPEDPRPAQGFDGEDGDMTVTVNAPEGALPEDSTMSVDRVTDEDALATIQSQFMSDVFAAVDISFADKDGVEIEPLAMVEVEIAMDGLENVQNPTVVHMKDDGTVELIGSQLISVNRSGSEKALRFYANSFSVYAIIGNTPDALRTITIYFHAKENGSTGNYETVNVQKLRVQEIIEREVPFYDPGVPGIAKTQSFEGWVAKTPNYAENSFGYDVEGMNVFAKFVANNWDLYVAQNNIPADASNIDVDFYAKIYDVVYVIYHDQAGAVQDTVMHHIQPGADSVNVEIDFDYVPFKERQKMVGWVEFQYVDQLGKYPTYKTGASSHVIKNESTQNVSATLELYPYIEDGYWLSFNSNIAANNEANGFQDSTSAVYISPKFYSVSEETEQPSFGVEQGKERPGYTFGGWYTDAAMKNRFTFGSTLTKDTTLYAKWTPAQTSYKIVYWKQKATDSVDALDEADPNDATKPVKQYDYAGYRLVENVTTGGNAQLEATDKTKGGTTNAQWGYYFYLNTNKTQDVTVPAKGDQSTILNVYYDRRVITYNFYGDMVTGSCSPYTTYSNYYYSKYQYFGLNNGTYYYLENQYPDTLTSNGEYYYYDAWYYAGTTTQYSGTIYHFTKSNTSSYPTASNSELSFGSIQGLYGAKLESFNWSFDQQVSDNKWPMPPSEYYVWLSGTDHRYLSKLTQFETSGNATATEINYFLCCYMMKLPTEPVYCVGQDKNGAWEEDLETYNVTSSETLYFEGAEYYGYSIDRYNYNGDNYSNATVYTSGEISFTQNSIGSNGAYVYWKRNKWALDFMNGTDRIDNISTTVYFEKELAGYEPAASAVPAAPEGYYFEGWYADATFQQRFDFSQTMPNNDVAVYAHFLPKWYRIVIHMKPDDPNAVVTVPGTTQDTTFCLAYGSTIQTSALANAQRAGYLFLGFYMDPNYKTHFNAEDKVPFGITSEAYATADPSERQGVDEISGKVWSDVGYPDVRGKIDIYARWRKDPDGAIGINVEYWANHDEQDTGYFDVDDHPDTWEDPKIYADLANAYGQPASKPDTAGEQFLYWQVLDENDEPTGQLVYPGKTFEVHLEDAKQERKLVENPNAPSGSLLPGGPLNADPQGATQEVWEETDTITVGEEYLIGIVNSGTNNGTTLDGKTYLLMNYNPATSAYYKSSSVSGYTANRTGYGIPAVLDDQGRVTGVDATNFSGATLEHVRWKFLQGYNSTQYQIQSVQNTSYYLRVGNDTSSTNLNLYPATFNNSYSNRWNWDATNHYLYHQYGTGYTKVYMSRLVSGATLSAFDSDSDSSYAKVIKLYKKVPATYSVTVHYQYENGTTAHADQVQDGLLAGASYSIASPEIEGYWADPDTVSGTISSTAPDDVEVTVVYHAVVEENELWVPTHEIEPGEEYLIGFLVNGEPYLLVNYNASETGDARYYFTGPTYTANSSTYTARYGYLAKATVDAQGRVTAVSGAANNLDYCEWTFSDATGGTVTSVQDSNRFLYFTNLGVYPNSGSGDTWNWVVSDTTNHTGSMYATYNGSNAYMVLRGVSNNTPVIWSSGTPYAGYEYSTSNAASIRLYRRAEESDMTYEVKFVDESLQTMAQTQIVTKGDTAIKPADPVKQDYYFLGWYEGTSDTPFDFSTPIMNDVLLVARFLYMYEVTYTVRLRAVYGMSHTTPDTHIYWYENNGTDAGHGAGAGDRYEDDPVPMYTATGIPYPTVAETPSEKTTWHTLNDEEQIVKLGLNYEGHVFLGWARLETQGTGVTGEGHPDLTERDLYLVWDRDRGVYRYNNPDNPNDTNNGAIVTDVYATEDQPYHDFYAVWYTIPKPFFVYHSATGKLEAIDSNQVETYDLTKVVTPGYLYGGYFMDADEDGVLGCIPKATMDAIVGSYNGGGEYSWTLNNNANSPILATHTITASEVEGFVTYTGAMYTNGQGTAYNIIGTDENGKPVIERENGSVKLYPLYWDKNDVVSSKNGGDRGSSLSPEYNKVYYIKEVPSSYLTSKVLFTYDTRDLPVPGGAEGETQMNQIVDLWSLTVTDDANYNEVGLQLADGKSASGVNAAEYQKNDALTKSFTLIQKPATDGSHPQVSVKIEAKDFGLKEGCGYVAVKHVSSFINNGDPSFTMLPYWITPDDVTVHNNGLYWSKVQQEYDPENPAVPSLTWERVFDGTEKMYFNLWHDNWTDNAPLQKVYFFKGEGAEAVHAWADLEYLNDNGMHAATVPAGEWDHVILVRMKPDGQMYGFDPENEDTFWDNKDKQTGNIALNTGNSVKSNSNCIDDFYGGSTAVTWAYYPAIPS